MAQRMLIYENAFLGYFEKRAHMSVVSVCIFVSLYVGMFVARANKVEGTMSPGGYLGKFLLGMCRWLLRAPTPL